MLTRNLGTAIRVCIHDISPFLIKKGYISAIHNLIYIMKGYEEK